jgi:hypothetical protein
VTPICGKGERMSTHLRSKCAAILQDQRDFATTRYPRDKIRPPSVVPAPTLSNLQLPVVLPGVSSLQTSPVFPVLHSQPPTLSIPAYLPSNSLGPVPLPPSDLQSALTPTALSPLGLELRLPTNPQLPAHGKRRCTSDSTAHDLLSGARRVPWSMALQSDFETDLCRMLVSCDIPWSAVSNPEMKKFLEKWSIADITLPDRRTLSGPILATEVEKVEADTKRRILNASTSRLAMGQCDGWKSISKKPLLGTMMTVNREVSLQIWMM